MARVPSERAVYMREYGARHTAAKMTGEAFQFDRAIQRIAELEVEVARLNRALRDSERHATPDP